MDEFETEKRELESALTTILGDQAFKAKQPGILAIQAEVLLDFYCLAIAGIYGLSGKKELPDDFVVLVSKAFKEKVKRYLPKALGIGARVDNAKFN